MMPKQRSQAIDLPRLLGVKRRSEPNDKPPFAASYDLNGRAAQDGLLERRNGLSAVYADRPYMYEHTPADGSGLDTDPLIYYNSWKRKTMAIATHEGVRYVFNGMIVVLNDFAGFKGQRLQIYRSRLQDDNLTELKNNRSGGGEEFIYDSTNAQVNYPYNPKYVASGGNDPAFMAWSMVYDAVNSRLLVALVQREDVANNMGTLAVFALDNIFSADFGGNALGTWMWLGGITLENLDGATDDRLTHDVDIELSAGPSGYVHLIYGYYNGGGVGQYTFKRKTWTGAAWVSSGTWPPSGTEDVYGGVLCRANATIYMAYLRVVKAGAAIIERVNWADDSSAALLIGDSTKTTVSSAFAAAEIGGFEDYQRSLLGPAIACDGASAYTLVLAYIKNGLGNLYVRVGGLSEQGIATDVMVRVSEGGGAEVYTPRMTQPDYGDLFRELTNWNIVVKDGVLDVFYGTENRGSGTYRTFRTDAAFGLIKYNQIQRKRLIFDATDQEYNALEVFPAEMIEDVRVRQSFLNAHCRYEMDASKRIQYIRFDTFDRSNAVNEGLTSEFLYRKLDKGSIVVDEDDGITLVEDNHADAKLISTLEQMAVIRFDAKQATEAGDDNPVAEDRIRDSLERITIVQGEDDRFYERQHGMWRLCLGQFGEGNYMHVYTPPALVDGRANFLVNHSALRIGCGVGVDGAETPPLWYDLIDRHIYFNSDPFNGGGVLNPYRLRGRRMMTAAPKAEEFVIDCQATAIILAHVDGDDTTEPVGTDTDDDNEHYARFGPTAKDGTFNTRNNGIDAVGYFAAEQNPYADWRHDPPPRVTHPYKTIIESQTVYGQANSDILLKQPYIEVFLAYAVRYDDGAISQLVTLGNYDNAGIIQPFKLGWEVTSLDDNNGYQHTNVGNMLKVVTRIMRWNWVDTVKPMNPRISSLMFFWGLKTTAAITHETCVWRLCKEVLVAKREPFDDKEWEGDSPWVPDIASPTNPDGAGEAFVKMVTYLDFKNYEKVFMAAENASIMLGHGEILSQDGKNAYLDGYRYACVVADRIFYGHVKQNDQVNETDVKWCPFQSLGGEAFVAPDVVSIENLKRMPFTINGLPAVGEETAVAVGDRDIAWGRVLREERDWEFRGTLQDVGCEAPPSIANISEMAESGRFNGISFLSPESGLRFFDLYSSRVLTDDINESFDDLRNPSGTRTLSTRKGIRALSAADCMAIHLPDHRLLLVHFPTAGVTWVRDFRAEAYIRGGGEHWTEWALGKNPLHWCVAPEGYLLFTDGEQLYKWDDTASQQTDAGVAIAFAGRTANFPVPSRAIAVPVKLVVDYDLLQSVAGTAPTLVIDVIKDDGQKINLSSSFAITRTSIDDVSTAENEVVTGLIPKRTRATRGFGLTPGAAKQNLSLAWSLTTPANVGAVKIYGLRLEVDNYGDI